MIALVICLQLIYAYNPFALFFYFSYLMLNALLILQSICIKRNLIERAFLPFWYANGSIFNYLHVIWAPSPLDNLCVFKFQMFIIPLLKSTRNSGKAFHAPNNQPISMAAVRSWPGLHAGNLPKLPAQVPYHVNVFLLFLHLKAHGHPILEAVRKETSGDFRHFLQARGNQRAFLATFIKTLLSSTCLAINHRRL